MQRRSTLHPGVTHRGMDRLQQIKARLAEAVADLERRSFAFAVVLSAARAFNEHHCMHLAAGIAYYAMFSLFPLLLGIIALASFLFESAQAQERIISAASQLLPRSSELVQRNIEQVLAARGTIGVVAVIVLLWSAKAGFGAIATSLNLAWNVTEKRSFWEQLGIQKALVFGVGIFFVLSITLTSALALLSSLSPALAGALGGTVFWVLVAEPFSVALSSVAFLLLYRFLPCRVVTFRDVWPGALVAGVLFEAAKYGYVIYVSRFASFQLVYGSLAAVIALLFWAWLSSAILLFGAEISATYPALNGRR